jgi:hypothetical protein
MTRMSLPNALLLSGAVLTALAVGWWWVVFDELVKTNTMSLSEIVPCLVRDSDICSLAQSLCKEEHFLSIRKYFVQAFWVSGALFIGAIAMRLADSGQDGHRA